MTNLRNVGYRLAGSVRWATAGLRRPADIFICGAQKSGTTYLSEALASLPDFYLPPIKEVHYFSAHYDRGLRWYLSHFETRRSPRLQVDASPSYMVSAVVPERIRAVNPNAKIVFLLRDPVSRAYSHFQHNRRAGYDDLDFSAALAAEDERIAADLAAVASNPGHVGVSLGLYSYRTRGLYRDQLTHYYEAFDPDQIVVLDSKRIFAHDPDELALLENFLGHKVHLATDRSLETHAGNYDAAPATDSAQLRAFYSELDPALAALTGRTFSWMKQ